MSHFDRIINGLVVINDKYSDCTILISGRETFHAHRLVLHLHSPVFDALLSEKIANGEDPGIIFDLKDDDPDALRAMLHFFYHGNYDVPDSTSPLAFHVAVFQIADKYQSSALKDVAYSLFDGILRTESWTSPGLIDAATKLEEILMTTEGAIDMRHNIIVAISKRSFDLYGLPAFKNFIQAHPDWVVDLLKRYDPESMSGGGDGAAFDGVVGGGGSGDDHDTDGGGKSMAGGGTNDQNDTDAWGNNNNNNWDNTHSSAQEPPASFPGTGRILGNSTNPSSDCVYKTGGRKPPTPGFSN